MTSARASLPMVTGDGVILHLDLPAVHEGERRFPIRGWVISHQPIDSVHLRGQSAALTPEDRPDVTNAFPAYPHAIGFKGTGRREDLSGGLLRMDVCQPRHRAAVDHPVPCPSMAPAGTRAALFLRQLGLAARRRLARRPADRWHCTLQRHLGRRRRRGGFFVRHHTEALMLDFARDFPDAHFIQIGANDGITFDPLRDILARPDVRWRGLLVEPVAHLFSKLQERCASHPGWIAERAAIGETDGSVEIFRLATRPGDPVWIDHLASFNRDVLRRTAAPLPDAEERIVAEPVPSLRVETLLTRHGIERIDLLVIDTEGWDWRVLRQFDLARLRPWLILVEHQHLAAEEDAAMHAHFRREGYDWVATPEGDTIAWRAN